MFFNQSLKRFGLKFLVEDRGKLLQVGRLLRELYQPLVTALSMIIHKDRGCCVFEYLCAGLLTGVCQAFLCIVDDELLTEGIDKMLRTTRDNKLIRVLGGEAYGVADHIAPQSTCGGDHHRVVLTDLHAFQRYDMQMIRIGNGAIRDILQGDELIEDAVSSISIIEGSAGSFCNPKNPSLAL